MSTSSPQSPASPAHGRACSPAGAGTVSASASATAVGVHAAAVAVPIDFAAPVKRIVTFHLNGLGDLIFTLPALASIRESFPGAHIASVVRPGLIPLLESSALVDETIARPRGGLSGQAALMARLASRHFDLAISFSQSRHSVLLAFATRAPVRVGFCGARMESLLTHRVAKLTTPYTVETHLDLIRAVGCNPRQWDYTGLLPISPQAFSEADALLESRGVSGEFVVAACEASERRGVKEWPAEHWIAALNEIAQRRPVVLVGTKPGSEVASGMTGPVVDLGGATNLRVLAAILGRAAVFAGIDSGVLHLAAAMKTPVVGIYGPTSWELTGPRGVPYRIVQHPVECSPCFLTQCPLTGAEHRKCLERINPGQVVQAIQELVGL